MKKANWLIKLGLIVAISNCFAEVAVIVHLSNSNNLDKQQIARIFLGKAKSFPDGSSVVPVNLVEGLATTEAFNSSVLSKSSSQLKAYWSKLVFTGKGTPPKEASSTKEVLELVSNNPSIIGYVDASEVNDSVKVVARF